MTLTLSKKYYKLACITVLNTFIATEKTRFTYNNLMNILTKEHIFESWEQKRCIQAIVSMGILEADEGGFHIVVTTPEALDLLTKLEEDKA